MTKAVDNRIALNDVRDIPVSAIATQAYVNAQGFMKESDYASGVLVSDGAGNVAPSTTLNLSNTVISSNSSGAALRVTQTGSGEALRIEDAANPDSSPLVVDTDGKLLVGSATSYLAAGFQIIGTGPAAQAGIFRSSADSTGPQVQFSKSRGATPVDFTAVNNLDSLGAIVWRGTKGDAFASVSAITCLVDGTPSTTSLPSKLTFTTTPTGSTTGSERLTIDNQGDVVINNSLRVEGGTAVPAGGTVGTGLLFSNSGNLGIFFGSGAPTLSAGRGSIYLRTDGGATSRMYINTDGATTWTNVTTAS